MNNPRARRLKDFTVAIEDDTCSKNIAAAPSACLITSLGVNNNNKLTNCFLRTTLHTLMFYFIIII